MSGSSGKPRAFYKQRTKSPKSYRKVAKAAKTHQRLLLQQKQNKNPAWVKAELIKSHKKLKKYGIKLTNNV